MFLFFEKFIPRFPLSWLHKEARFISKLLYYLFPLRKRVALTNLAAAFPNKTPSELKRILKGAYENVLILIQEFFWLPKLTADDFKKMINFTNPEITDQKLRTQKGLILLSAHFGNWELIAYGISRILGKPFHVVVKQQTNKAVDRRINSIRALSGNRMLDMSSVREVMRLLSENKIIAMLSDQFAPGENTVKVKFFLNNVSAYAGAAAIALKTGAPVLFGVGVRRKDFSYDLTLHVINTDGRDIYAIMQEYYNLLMNYIRLFPEQYLWFHRRYKNIIPY